MSSATRYPVERIFLPMMGDVRMNSRLKDLYELGSIREWADPFGDDDLPKSVDIDDSHYSVVLVRGGGNEEAVNYPAIFHMMAQVVIITFDIASTDSLQKLKRLYSEIPPPQDGRIYFVEATPKRFVSMDYYPIILIGCRHPADSVRAVEKQDIEQFVADHPGCTFVGECEPDKSSIQTVHNMVGAAVNIYHGLRKQAQEVEQVPKVQRQSSKGISAEKPAPKKGKRKCLLM